MIEFYNNDPSTRALALAGGSCSGFRPTGVLKGATGLSVGLHMSLCAQKVSFALAWQC